jgi:uncharacterized protein YlxW (UPF0749 family)
MEQLYGALSYLNATVVMWVVISLAAVFIVVVAADWFWSERKGKKRRHRGNFITNYLRNFRSAQRTLKQEMTRRRRHSDNRRARDHRDK